MRSTIIACAAIAIGLLARPAEASDFWDSVRDPGARVCLRAVGQAREALREGDGTTALELADHAIAASSRAEAWLVRARSLALLKRPKEATESLRKTLELDDRALDGHVEDTSALTLSAIDAGELEFAAGILGRLVLSMKPSGQRRALYVLYADLLGTLGPERSREALLAYRHALYGVWNREARTTIGLALALHRAGEADEAMRKAKGASGGRGGLDRGLLAAIARTPLPAHEKAARRAITREAAGLDASAEWREAAVGPWSAHALERLPENRR